MSDRIRTLTVQLARDTRTDDAEVIKTAIGMIKGVAAVEDGDVVGLDEHMARDAALRDFIIMQMEILSMALVGHTDKPGYERFKQIRELVGQSYREKTGRNLFS